MSTLKDLYLIRIQSDSYNDDLIANASDDRIKEIFRELLVKHCDQKLTDEVIEEACFERYYIQEPDEDNDFAQYLQIECEYIHPDEILK